LEVNKSLTSQLFPKKPMKTVCLKKYVLFPETFNQTAEHS
jgi:hypothetical protein